MPQLKIGITFSISKKQKQKLKMIKNVFRWVFSESHFYPPVMSYSANDVDFILENGRPGSGSLYHNLNLTSAYSHADACARDATTNQGEWCTVDYIFYG